MIGLVNVGLQKKDIEKNNILKIKIRGEKKSLNIDAQDVTIYMLIRRIKYLLKN